MLHGSIKKITITITKHSACGATESPIDNVIARATQLGYTLERVEESRIKPPQLLWQDNPEGAITAFENIIGAVKKTPTILYVSSGTIRSITKVFEKEQFKITNGLLKLPERTIKFEIFDEIEPETLLFNAMDIEPESAMCLLDRGCKSDFNVKGNRPKWLKRS
jgi:hypothetical protein